MHMNKRKKQVKRVFVFLLSFILVMSTMIFQPNMAYAYKKAEVKEVTASDFSDMLDYDWSAKIENNKLSMHLVDKRAESDTATIPKSKCVAYLYCAMNKRDYKEFSKNTCEVSCDFSKEEDGIKSIMVSVYLKTAGQSNLRWRAQLSVEVTDGVASIHSPYGQVSVEYLDDLNENYPPELYTNPATINGIFGCDKYDEILAKARELTKKCSTDKQKIKTIHDWLCKNFAYDMESLSNNDYIKQNSASWVFENKRAVCGGFTNLAILMYRAVGIPCVNMNGYSESSGVLGDGVENRLRDNHAWSMVYYEGKWHYIDITWDCMNFYYGKNNVKNISGKNPSYRYFGVSAEMFGVDHYPMGIDAEDQTIVDVELKNVKKQYVSGDAFSNQYQVYFITNTGKRLYTGKTGEGTCTGYDMDKPGTQTVTFYYKGFTKTFDITVTGKDRIRAVPNEEVLYLRGTDFKPEFKLYHQSIDGTEELITNEDEIICTGYDTTKAGKQTVTVTYKGQTTSFVIHVLDVTGIRAVPNGKKTYEIGESFQPEFDLYYVMADGSKMLIADGASKAECSGYDANRNGTQTITVSFHGYNTTYEITVEAKKTEPPKVTVTPTIKPTEKPDVAPITKPEQTPEADQNTDKKDNQTNTNRPKGTKISKLKAGSKKLVVKIKAQKDQTTGYQIRYSLKKNMKGAKMVTVKKNTQLTVSLTKLQAKRTYYVQVRTYHTIEGKKYYSNWSKAISKKTLK